MSLSTTPLPELADSLEKVKDEVLRGLSAQSKTLSPWLFYDDEGSRLFEEITTQPEYYVTRTERGILEEHGNEIVQLAAGGERVRLVELGAGSGIKTELLIRALLRRQLRVQYLPIDVSPSALEDARDRLELKIAHLKVEPRVENYSHGIAPFPNDGARTLVLWIGSSIGNYSLEDAKQVLASLRRRMRRGDALLLGVDNVKPEPLLVAAYNDAAGVTAAFNKNVLVRLNREVGANFDVDAFEHRALWNAKEWRMEMHLFSRAPQVVRIAATGQRIRFAAGESIHTENSYKFTDKWVGQLCDAAGFSLERTWTDAQQWFGEHLAVVA